MPEPRAGNKSAVRVALGFALLCVLVVGLLWWRADDPPAGDEPRVTTPRVSTPHTVGDFALDRSTNARDFARKAERRLAARSEGSEVTVATYAGPAGQVVLVGTVFADGSGPAGSLGADDGTAVRDYLGQIGLQGLREAAAGDTGGALVCGREPDDGPRTCGWGDATGVLVSLRFATGDLSTAPVRDVAAVSRTFLAAVVTG